MSRRIRAALVVVIALVAACGSDTDPAATPSSSSTDAPAATTTPTPPSTSAPPTTEASVGPRTVVDARGEEVTVESVERIIPLDGDVAEVVFALGMGDRVVATDISATFPAEADALPEIGYQRALAAEPIIGFEPTIVLGTDIAGPPETIAALEAVGIPVVIVPREPGPEGPAVKIRAVADALGVSDVGAELADRVQAGIAEATVEEASGPRAVALYVRGTNVQLVLGEGSGIHWLLEAAGAVDIADELGVVETEQISAEAILAAAPEVIIVPAIGLDSVGGIDGLLAIDGLGETPAGQSGAVLSYDDQLMLGNGPRTADFLSALAEDLQELTTTGATE
ncbi:MAG: ABC transporter substrate-binding protein [Actinomycetota bacterium]